MKTKRYIAWARVSSREQEREGFSLEVQEDALVHFARKTKGQIVRLFKIAETASKNDQRKIFREMLAYAKQHADKLDGILFYKIDRAARNLFDYVELERLESVHGLSFISVTQPTENTPSGRMMRRTLATMAAFTTEQQSLDVRDGLAKRVEHGLLPSHPPYGYRNVRVNDRGLIERHPQNAIKVQRIFVLYTTGALTVEQIVQHLFREGQFYTESKPRFTLSKVYGILTDRSYLGEIWFQDEWRPGTHPRLIDDDIFDDAQVRLGEKTYRSHQMVYAGELIVCDHCGRPITGEPKTKAGKSGFQTYVYYRCSQYNIGDHPRLRMTEADVDRQVFELLSRLERGSRGLAGWMELVIREQFSSDLTVSRSRLEEAKRQLSLIDGQQDELLNLRLGGMVDQRRYETKHKELEERAAILRTQLEDMAQKDSSMEERGGQARFLFTTILRKWPTADYRFKRRVLETLFGKLRLFKDELRPDNRTPFELLIAR